MLYKVLELDFDTGVLYRSPLGSLDQPGGWFPSLKEASDAIAETRYFIHGAPLAVGENRRTVIVTPETHPETHIVEIVWVEGFGECAVEEAANRVYTARAIEQAEASGYIGPEATDEFLDQQ